MRKMEAAPKGQNRIAQGNALGLGAQQEFALKGRHRRICCALSGLIHWPETFSQGVALGSYQADIAKIQSRRSTLNSPRFLCANHQFTNTCKRGHNT